MRETAAEGAGQHCARHGVGGMPLVISAVGGDTTAMHAVWLAQHDFSSLQQLQKKTHFQLSCIGPLP